MLGQRRQRISAVVTCVLFAGIVACAKKDEATVDTATGAVARTDSAATATAPTATTPTITPTNPLTITGGDPEIVQVMAAVNQAEVQDGRLAQRQARSAAVKAYARELIAAHTKSLQAERKLAQTLNVELPTASSSDTSNKAAPSATGGMSSRVVAHLDSMHQQTMQRIRAMKGADFDSAFVNAQVMGHQQVLDLLQRTQAQDSTVQKHVTEAAQEVQSHLEKAQQLQQKLTSAGADSAMKGDSASKGKAKGDTTRRG